MPLSIVVGEGVTSLGMCRKRGESKRRAAVLLETRTRPLVFATMKAVALLLLLAIAATRAYTPDSSPVDEARNNFYKLEEQLWLNITDIAWAESGLGGDVEATKALVAFSKELEDVPGSIRPSVNLWLWRSVTEKISKIDGLYKHCLEFAHRQIAPGAVPSPIRDWMDIVESVLLDPENSINKTMSEMQDLLRHGDLFRSVLQEKNPDLCDMQVSPHQLIYDMYNTVSLTEIKGYAMMQFSWMLLRIYGKGNFTQEASLTRQRYGERTVQTATAARAALKMARRDTYRCDPPAHKEGETYAQVTRLLQGYLVNEVDLNDRNTCGENCGYYTATKQHSCYNEVTCDRLPKCGGKIRDCQYIDSDMRVYSASRSSIRRYEMIEYENGRKFGKSSNSKGGSTKVDSWWRWNLYHCSYCICLCEDPVQIAERTFSLREATADYTMNKVVTGLRFVKLGRVFHLQISEGTLGARGQVTAGSWVPVQAFDPNDVEMQEGVDYHTLTYEERAMDLDELDSPTGHILTGVRFRLIGAHLHFEIRSTPFNYTTGRLVPERSQWISNDNTDGAEKPRTELKLTKPDMPTRSSYPLPVDSQHDQYIQFVNTDFEADAAQSTVPFIDIQSIMPMKGSALSSGAGVIHRGAPGSGGFIALKLFTYNYSGHVKAEAPPSTFIEDSTEFVPIMVN